MEDIAVADRRENKDQMWKQLNGEQLVRMDVGGARARERAHRTRCVADVNIEHNLAEVALIVDETIRKCYGGVAGGLTNEGAKGYLPQHCRLFAKGAFLPD